MKLDLQTFSNQNNNFITMKKQMLSIAMLVLSSSLLFTACKKDDDKKEDRRENLTTGQWLQTAGTSTTTMNGVTSPAVDEFASYDACEKDDLNKFETSGSVTVDEGATKCDPSDPQTYSGGNWTLTDNNNRLTIGVQNLYMVDYEIKELSSSTLRLSTTFKDTVQGMPYSTLSTVTFTKK